MLPPFGGGTGVVLISGADSEVSDAAADVELVCVPLAGADPVPEPDGWAGGLSVLAEGSAMLDADSAVLDTDSGLEVHAPRLSTPKSIAVSTLHP